jgi:hypothetical protein
VSKPKEKDLQFLQEHKDDLFTGKNHLLRILRGHLHVPRTKIKQKPLDELDIQGMSFGQYVSWCAQEKGYSLKDFTKVLDIRLQDLEQIYDDIIFPWELEPSVVRKIGYILGISTERLQQVIRDHKMDPWVLKQRLAGGASAARTHFTLDRKKRENELLQADLIVQESRENDKRYKFLDLL